MHRFLRVAPVVLIVILVAGCGDDFEDRAVATCEKAYQSQVGREFPDRSDAGHRAFVRGCVEVEKKRRAEFGSDYEP